MNNLYITKIWEDINMKEWLVKAQNEYVSVTQTVYVQEETIQEIINTIQAFLDSGSTQYVEIGKKSGNYTPALSIKMKTKTVKGDVLIEMDMEVGDSEQREHRCSLYIETDIGALERLKEQLVKGFDSIKLYEE